MKIRTEAFIIALVDDCESSEIELFAQFDTGIDEEFIDTLAILVLAFLGLFKSLRIAVENNFVDFVN